jgi:UDPglucose 6-dehydrogenase
MNIAVVGTGYVGLVTGTCLAESGANVTCVDIDEKKVEKMKSGIVPIYEPHLDVLFERNIKQNRLRFTTNLKEAIEDTTIIFLALPTPPGEDGSADLSYILGVAKDLGEIITDYKIIIDKSTVPVGTAEKVKATVNEALNKRFGANDPNRPDFDIVSNPEFLREGFAVDDFMKPDRIVIGSSSERANKILDKMYAPFVRQGNPVIYMDEKSAELTKYAANSFLATKISFMNEIANLCEQVGANVDDVRRGIGTDTRIGNRFLFPGIGYGGSCFPKDVQALSKSSSEVNYDFKILKAVMDVNKLQKTVLIPKIKSHFGGSLKGKKFAVWGLSFKPDTDDIREAPSLYNIEELLSVGAEIVAYDPEAMENVKTVLGDKITYVKNAYDALENADALLIFTEWQIFRNPDFNKISSLLKNKVIFDGRNLYDLETMKSMDYTYTSIGREEISK